MSVGTAGRHVRGADGIEGGKHFTPEDHPARVAAALQSLIEEVSAGGNS